MQIKFPARFGKYILLDRLNSGGMAEVFRAMVTGVENFQRMVAIKCILPTLAADAQFTSMFIDEAKLASQLSHAGIVQIYELGRLHERLYIAMELVHGRDLRHILRTAKRAGIRIPPAFAAYVMSKAAEALDSAHRKVDIRGEPLGLVHRDVSPQNILVSYEGEVKVVDFGIAKAEVRATKTQAGVLKGKFAHMSPEQIMGLDIDRRADIFALGTVLYEVTTGNRLFGGENDLSVLEKVRNARIPDIRRSFPECPEELERVLHKALTRDRDKRYSHASELAEGLEPVLIEDRSIFGAKRAALLMESLYADEIAQLAQLKRQYARVTDADCVDSFGESHEGGPAPVVVTEELSSPVAEVAAAVAAAPASEEEEDLDGATTVCQPPAEILDNLLTASGSSPAPRSDWAIPTSEMLGASPEFDELEPSVEGGDTVAQAELSKPELEPPRNRWDTVSRSTQIEPVGLAPQILLGAMLLAIVVMGSAVVAALIKKQSPRTTVVTPLDLNQQSADELTGMGASPPSGKRGRVARQGDGRRGSGPTDRGTGGGRHSAASSGRSGQSPGAEGGSEGGAEPRRPSSRRGSGQASKGQDDTADSKSKRPRRARYGYVQVGANGVKRAKVFVDGKEIGYLPLIYHRVRTGKREIKVIELDANGMQGRIKVEVVQVTSKHTRRSPLKIVLTM